MLTDSVIGAIAPNLNLEFAKLQRSLDEANKTNLELQRRVHTLEKPKVAPTSQVNFCTPGATGGRARQSTTSPVKSKESINEAKIYYSYDDPRWYTWMQGSTSPALRDSDTTVTVEQGVRAKPNAHVKPDVQAFYASCQENIFLKEFADDMLHGDFIAARRALVTRLSALAYVTAESDKGVTDEKAALDAGETTAARYLKNAVLARGNQSEGGKMAMIGVAIEAAEQEGHVTIDKILEELDSQYAAPTQMERDGEFNDALAKLTVAEGVLPSNAIGKAKHILQRKFGTGNPELVERSVRSHISEIVKQQIVAHDFMEGFSVPMSNPDFLESDLDKWKQQFRMLERNHKDAFSKALAAKSNAAAGGNPTATEGGG